MEEFPGNSRRPPQPSEKNAPPAEEKKLHKVVTGNVIRRKKPLGRRILDTFFSGDSGVVGYLAREVLVPAFQTLLTDIVTQGIEKAVYGEVRSAPRSARGSSFNRPHVSYNRPSTVVRHPSGNMTPARRPITQPSSRTLEEIVLESQIEAQAVAEELYDVLERYNAVSVADLKVLLGETPQFTDYKWGWTDLSSLQIGRASRGGGWFLSIADPEDLR